MGQASTPGLGMRLLGRIIDAFVVGIPMIILFAIIPGLAIGGLVYSLVTAALGFGYFVWMESTMGATIGKRLLNMQVVSTSGGNPSMEASARRNWWLLIGVLSGIPVLGLLASLVSLAVVIYIAVTINSDPNGRGWHDQMADASVVPT